MTTAIGWYTLVMDVMELQQDSSPLPAGEAENMDNTYIVFKLSGAQALRGKLVPVCSARKRRYWGS